MTAGVVVVGGGQAGFSVASGLRANGFDGPVTILSAERHLPYQRPPLSKAYLTRPNEVAVDLAPQSFYQERRIDVRLGHEVASLDAEARSVRTRSGLRVDFDHLVLATGARNRRLPIPGAHLSGVYSLRTIDESRLIAAALSRARTVVIVGGGFIGLEIARAARSLGTDVTVIEIADQLLARVLSPQLAAHLRQRHESSGLHVLTGTTVTAVEGDSSVRSVVTDHGSLPADLVIFGIGAAPRDELAAEAGLLVDDGVVVDDQLRSVTDPRVSAIGDCARYPHPKATKRIRVESVQNAVDQGTLVARRLAGEAGRYVSLPWFWSDQGDIKLQIAGLRYSDDEIKVIAGGSPNQLAAYAFRDGRLAAVETLNWPAEHLAARRLLGQEAVMRTELDNATLGTILRGRRAQAVGA